MVSIRSGHVSITGNFRENNEDACVVDDAGRYFIVADGMGGQSAGEKASELATEIVPRRLEQGLDFEKAQAQDVVRVVDEAVAEANAEIMALGEIDPEYRNMGTTIVFTLRIGEKLFVGGVGDSRGYLLRDGKLQQLTTDHSLTQALVDAGTITESDAANHRYRNVLYRYLGTKEGGTGTKPKELEARPGDRFLLCSDGITDGTDDGSIQEILASHDDPQEAAEALVQAAEAGGSKDNITCVVVHVDD